MEKGHLSGLSALGKSARDRTLRAYSAGGGMREQYCVRRPCYSSVYLYNSPLLTAFLLRQRPLLLPCGLRVSSAAAGHDEGQGEQIAGKGAHKLARHGLSELLCCRRRYEGNCSSCSKGKARGRDSTLEGANQRRKVKTCSIEWRRQGSRAEGATA